MLSRVARRCPPASSRWRAWRMPPSTQVTPPCLQAIVLFPTRGMVPTAWRLVQRSAQSSDCGQRVRKIESEWPTGINRIKGQAHPILHLRIGPATGRA